MEPQFVAKLQWFELSSETAPEEKIKAEQDQPGGLKSTKEHLGFVRAAR